jgi:S1/P1 Nuclease
MKRDYSRFLKKQQNVDYLIEEFNCVNPSPKLQETYARSYALRMLIHYLGDVHQPLHCLARIDKKFPIGDKGGNLFTLPNHYESADLHAVWDSVLYKFHNSPPLPFTAETW